MTSSSNQNGAENGKAPAAASGGISVADSIQAMIESKEPRGLTGPEAEKALAKHGHNEVVVKESPILLQILSRYLGMVPLFVTLTAVLSAAIFSKCIDDPL